MSMVGLTLNINLGHCVQIEPDYVSLRTALATANTLPLPGFHFSSFLSLNFYLFVCFISF